MRAVVVEAFDRSPLVMDVPKPVPSSHEVLVRIEASGLCHTDIHAAHGDWPVQPQVPFTPGHEGVGIVEAVGDDVDAIRSATGSPSPGSGTAAGRAATASMAARPSASPSATPGIRWTARSPSTPSRMPASSYRSPTASTLWTPLRSPVRA